MTQNGLCKTTRFMKRIFFFFSSFFFNPLLYCYNEFQITIWNSYITHGFPGPFGFHSARKKIMSYLFSILLSGPRRGGGSNWNLKFWIVKWENMSERGPAGIEVVRIYGPNSVCSCLGPQLVHLWKGTTMFGLVLAEYMAQWCVE